MLHHVVVISATLGHFWERKWFCFTCFSEIEVVVEGIVSSHSGVVYARLYGCLGCIYCLSIQDWVDAIPCAPRNEV